MKCIARCKTNLLIQCNHKKLFNSDYCKKHMNNTEKTINEELYNTKQINDFLNNANSKTIKKNILLCKYILQKNNYKYTNNINVKSTIMYFNMFLNYYKNINYIIKLQSIIRKKNIYNIHLLKGPGINKESINSTDFYTCEDINKIHYNYIFSYNEENNIYFFDIRSFKLLIKNNKNENLINPYNRKIIPTYVINNYNTIIKHLINNNINIEFEEDILSETQLFNQKVITIFQKIDNYGYNTSIEWFTNLSIYSLKKLWANLEDIWNYRSNLSHLEKNNIIQNVNLQPFSKFKYINKNIEKKYLQELILDDINIFLTSGINQHYSNIGCLYVLTALSYVSKDCIEAMPWLLQV